jgi:hypothetical protein
MHTNLQVLLGTPLGTHLGTIEQRGEPFENLNLMGTHWEQENTMSPTWGTHWEQKKSNTPLTKGYRYPNKTMYKPRQLVQVL